MVISVVERIRLSKLAHEMTEIVRGDSTFVDFHKTILNFASPFEMEYNDKFVTNRTANIAKDMTVSKLLTGMSVQSYYQYVWVSGRLLKPESVLALVKSLIGEHACQEVWKSPI